MAAGTNTQGAKTGEAEEDLSMEEILQSIRRIIADDDSEGKPKPAEAKPGNGKSSDAIHGSDVLELTDMVEDDGSVISLKESNEQKPGNDTKDVLNTIDEALTPEKKPDMPEAKPEVPKQTAPSQDDIDAMFDSVPVAAPAPEPVPAAVPVAAPAPAPVAAPVATVKPDSDSLLSAEATSAAASSIQKLKSAEPAPAPLSLTPSAQFMSGNTVENMVMEMLRPMMKSWLDDNLPQIVDRIVEREVKKLTKYLTDKGE